MKKRIINVLLTLSFLGLMTFYTYTVQNPIVVSKEKAHAEIENTEVYVPNGWTTGSSVTEEGEEIVAFLDTDSALRVAVASIELQKKLNEVPSQVFEALCTQVVNEDIAPLNEPVARIEDNCYRMDFQYNVENDLIYICFVAPIDDNKLFEVMEVKPTEDTKRIRTEAINAIIQNSTK